VDQLGALAGDDLAADAQHLVDRDREALTAARGLEGEVRRRRGVHADDLAGADERPAGITRLQ
jgi:hypothetical protein